MSLRDELAPVLARDARYDIQAYAFVFESLEHARALKRRARASLRERREGRRARISSHITGQQLCHAARELALGHYGALAQLVLGQWGVRSTSDIGNIVYNLIASGDLEKTSSDARSDFDGVYDFTTALRPSSYLGVEEVA